MSLLKSFASVVVCKILHEKFPELGKNVLDTPIRKLIPEFNFTLNDSYSHIIYIIELQVKISFHNKGTN